jgi:hypothetical protein
MEYSIINFKKRNRLKTYENYEKANQTNNDIIDFGIEY